MKKWNRSFLLYSLFYMAAAAVLVSGFVFIFDMKQVVLNGEVAINNDTFKNAEDIVCNNIMNFMGYIIMYPIFPVLFITDLLFSSWTIAVSIVGQGATKTILLLMPHGMIEIPNFLIFTYFSYRNFLLFWKKGNISLRIYSTRILTNWRVICVCMVLILIAGLVEGIITPYMYNSFNKIIKIFHFRYIC